jgi:hypothetical protein
MTEILQELNLNQIATLLNRYGFELRGVSPQEILTEWQPIYPLKWIRLAVVEALYQGRYKVISVEQILNLWLRRGQPTFHFNLEFERLICHSLLHRSNQSEPEIFISPPEPRVEALPEVTPPPPPHPRATMSNLEDLFARLSPPPTSLEELDSSSTSRVAINQFIPLLDSSDLYPKLKSVVQKT